MLNDCIQKQRWCVLISILIFCSSLALAQFTVPCGPSTPGGNKVKAIPKPITDPSGKSYMYYCINKTYYKAELTCPGKPVICLGKCVYTGGQNAIGIIRDPGTRNIEKIVHYNWDPACGVPLEAAKPGETSQQYVDRMKAKLDANGCDYMCYMWCKPKNKTGDGYQTIQVYKGGELVDEIKLANEHSHDAYDGGLSYLDEDLAMYEDEAPPQEGYVIDTDVLIDDFEDGIVGERYTALPGTGPITESNGAMEFFIAQTGDGINIDVTDFEHPACLALRDLNFTPFELDHGFGILLDFESGETIDVQFYQDNSVRVKVEEKDADGTVTRQLSKHVDDVNLDDIADIQIDWIKQSKGGIDYVEIEIYLKGGGFMKVEAPSGLTHDASKKKAYRMRGLDISKDPLVSIGQIEFANQHIDTVEGFEGDLTVANMLYDCPNGLSFYDSGVITFQTLNADGQGIPERPIHFEVVEDLSSGGIDLVNSQTPLGLDRQTAELATDMEGFAVAEFVATRAGTVVIEASIPNTDFYEIMEIEIVLHEANGDVRRQRKNR